MAWNELPVKAGPSKRNVSIRVYEKKNGTTVLLTLSSVVWAEAFGSHDGDLKVLTGDGEDKGKILLRPVAAGEGVKVASMKYSAMLRIPLPEFWQDVIAHEDGLAFEKIEVAGASCLVVTLPDWLHDADAAQKRIAGGKPKPIELDARGADRGAADTLAAVLGETAKGHVDPFADAPPHAREVMVQIERAAWARGSDCVNLTNKQLAQMCGLEQGKVLAPVAWLVTHDFIEKENPRTPGGPFTFTVLRRQEDGE